MTTATNHCGTCTMCCKVMAIKEIDKPANQWCKDCTPGKGCNIYETRPESCAGFECVWLQTQYRRHGEHAMPAEARPDRSKVVIDVRGNGAGLVFFVDPAYPEAHKRGYISKVIGSSLRRGEEVVVAVGDRRTLLRG